MDRAAASVSHLGIRNAQQRTPLALPATKFDAPRPRPDDLSRTGQLTRIDPHARLLLLCAPPGYGKTSLLGQWVARAGERSLAWIVLDAGEDATTPFWGAVLTSIAGACPGVGARSQEALAVAGIDLRAGVLAPLIDELRDHGRPLDLVLDDLHAVSDRAVHASLEWLLEHAPPNLSVAIATRRAPAFALGRLRARGELTELWAADLRFDADEVERLLNGQLGLELDRADVDALADHTEGWPAAVRLAALSLGTAEDRSRLAAAFAGDDALIVDYVGPELLRDLDAPTRAFLRRTSILQSFCVELCDAVAGGEPSAEQALEELRTANLFLVCLDRCRRWFRYGRLFGELLRAELLELEPELVVELHRRAASWYAGAGDTATAIAHDLQAGDIQPAARRVARSWASLLRAPDRARVAACLELLPEDELVDVPGYLVARAWIAAHDGEPEESGRLAALAREHDAGGPLPDGAAGTESALALIGARFAFGDAGRAGACASRAAQLETSQAYAVDVALALGSSCLWAGGPRSQARLQLQQAVRLGCHRSGDAGAVVEALAHLAYLDLLAGDAAAARDHVARARRCAESLQQDTGTAGCAIAIGRGWLLLADGRAAAAEVELRSGLDRAGALAEPLHAANALRLLATCAAQQDERVRAASLIRRARVIVAEQCADPGLAAELVESAAAELRVAPEHGTPACAAAVADPLSERELDVLRMLAGTLSLPSIAQEMFVAHNTIKTHTRAIYRKLCVGGRGEAVSRARDIGVLRTLNHPARSRAG